MIRDWYFGPCVLNHSNTSVSTRREIGCFEAGSTTVASFQNSSGKSANSGGDVAAISRSEVRRRRARSARPRRATLLRSCGFPVRFALTAVTLPSRNDASNDGPAGRGPIGVHHGERHTLRLAECNDSALSVIAARIYALQRDPLEDLRGELKVESALAEISSALLSIPTEAHLVSIRLYIQRSNPPRAGQRAK